MANKMKRKKTTKKTKYLGIYVPTNQVVYQPVWSARGGETGGKPVATKQPRSRVQVRLSGPRGCTHGILVRQATSLHKSYRRSVEPRFQAETFTEWSEQKRVDGMTKDEKHAGREQMHRARVVQTQSLPSHIQTIQPASFLVFEF